MRMLAIFLLAASQIAATPNMSLDLPVVGVTLGPTWATQLNAAFTLVDSHDHSMGKGLRITQNGMNITATLELNDNHLSEIKSARFQDQTSALGSGSDLRSVYVAGGDLYFNNASGTQIQMTSGSGLNTSLLGGIAGDYSASGATVYYLDSSKLYTFRQPDTTDADIKARNVIVSGDATITGLLAVSNASPIIALNDTTGAAYDYQIIVDSNNMTFDYDVDGDTVTDATVFSYDSSTQVMSAPNVQASTLETTGDISAFGKLKILNATPELIMAKTGTDYELVAANSPFDAWYLKADTDSNGSYETIGLTWDLSTFTFVNTTRVQNDIPSMRLIDSTTGSDDFFMNANGDVMTLTVDTNDDGSADSTPYAISASEFDIAVPFFVAATTTTRNVIPDATANNRTVGSNAARFNEMWSNRYYATGNLQHPANATEVTSRNARNNVVGWGRFDSSSTADVLGFNIADITNPSTGQYVVTLDSGINGDDTCVVTPISVGSTCVYFGCDWSDSTHLFINARLCSTGALINHAAQFAVFGYPISFP